MSNNLAQDHLQFDQLIDQVVIEAKQFLSTLVSRPVGITVASDLAVPAMLEAGMGAQAALATFREHYAAGLSGSAGPRYFGFVTGGVTPAALVGDWLASVYDQNATGSDESIAPQIEVDTIALLRQLFGLSDAHTGSFVSGATMANFVGLALGRQWLGRQQGVDFAQQGVWRSPAPTVFSATPHSSIYKALSMLGLGRASMTQVACLPEREAVDPKALETLLQAHNQQPCIVVANAGTVNSVDFDDLAAIAELKRRYPFWLHVDAAFGGFAACSPIYCALVDGIDQADSITIDAHKWLNVPYDSAMQFTRHLELQTEVFQNAAVYLDQDAGPSNFVHLTPENSRRLRALPSWFTLMAYGKQGYREIVERNCHLAHWLGDQIDASDQFELLSPVRLNGICFTLAHRRPLSLETIQDYLRIVRQEGTIFMTPTLYRGVPAIRVSITNWRTTQADVEIGWRSIVQSRKKWLD